LALPQFPIDLCASLPQLTSLNLSHNLLRQLPPEIEQLMNQQLAVLDLSFNALESLPDAFHEAYVSHRTNPLPDCAPDHCYLPTQFAHCRCRYSLLELNLSFNQGPLTNLPSSFDRLLGREVAVRLLGTVAKDIPDGKQPTGYVASPFWILT
jgi:Leucine-rich repeat (LRR) protein